MFSELLNQYSTRNTLNIKQHAEQSVTLNKNIATESTIYCKKLYYALFLSLTS